jgi:protein-S-isoprenylcysteine O-methyltransferase Ste14
MITIGTAIWFHTRVVADEKNLVQTLSQPYIDYLFSVKRWIPGLF